MEENIEGVVNESQGATAPGKIKNEKYKAFLQGETLKVITKEDFVAGLDGIEHPEREQARALAILLWATGARPNEVLRLKREAFRKEGRLLKVTMPGSKGGVSRVIGLPLSDSLIVEVWAYVSQIKWDKMDLFLDFISKAKRQGVNTVRYSRKGGVLQKSVRHHSKEYPVISDKLFHWFKKWFGLPPYYFRHNRFTVAGETESIHQLKLLKGAKSYNSVGFYIHQTEKQMKKMSKVLVK